MFSRRQSLQSFLSAAALAASSGSTAWAGTAEPLILSAPGEFEPQDYIWLSWVERGFLGSAPFSSAK